MWTQIREYYFILTHILSVESVIVRQVVVLEANDVVLAERLKTRGNFDDKVSGSL